MESNNVNSDRRRSNEKPQKQWDEQPGEKPVDPRQQQIERKRKEDEKEQKTDPVGNRENQKENQRNQDPVRKGERWEEE